MRNNSNQFHFWCYKQKELLKVKEIQLSVCLQLWLPRLPVVKLCVISDKSHCKSPVWPPLPPRFFMSKNLEGSVSPVCKKKKEKR